MCLLIIELNEGGYYFLVLLESLEVFELLQEEF